MKIEFKKREELVPYLKNAKAHPDEQVEKIAKSILEFGFNLPLLIDSKGEIIAGHGRLLAAEKIGLDEVPVISIAHLSAKQIRAFRIADNRVAESKWLENILKEELLELKDLSLDLELTGFEEKEINKLFIEAPVNNGKTDENSVPGLEGDAQTKNGTEKPVECMARPVRNNTKAGDWVYDAFGGSGTTIIACEKLNRKCLMMEIDPHYCDVIVKRWEEFTGKKAKRVKK